MTATWQTANLNGGVQTSGNYVLGDNWGGATDLYGADTAPMYAPAYYTTNEITDSTSNVLPSDAVCVPGEFRLDSYQTSSVSFADALTEPTSTIVPSFTGLTSDAYVVVRNTTCPTTGSLTIDKEAIGGNDTFNFTSNIPGGSSFSITTASGTGYSQTFTNLTPGVYSVTEVKMPKGWTQTDSDCSAVSVIAGGAATCTITNTSNKLLGEIRGTKYEDKDGDGKLIDGDHHRLTGWTIDLTKGTSPTIIASVVTDSHGNYRFSNLPAGTYHVSEVNQPGWIQTYPASGSYTIVLAAGKISKKDDFDNFKLGTILGMKFYDKNGNGRKDGNELGLSGWTIKLTKFNSSFATTTVTDANGNYSFTNLGPGSYTVREVQQSGWQQSTPNPPKLKMYSGGAYKWINFGNKHPGDGKKTYGGFDWNNSSTWSNGGYLNGKGGKH